MGWGRLGWGGVGWGADARRGGKGVDEMRG